jgi:hypothetical protein
MREFLSVKLAACSIMLVSLACSIAEAQTTNTAPVISGTPQTVILRGKWFDFLPKASDADGDKLTFSITNQPKWLSFLTWSGGLYGSPSGTDVGVYSNIRISVSDGKSTVSLPPFSIEVTAANTPPTISGVPPTSVLVGSKYYFKPSAADYDKNPLKFRLSGRPSWATFNATTGELTGTPTAANVGTAPNIVISVTDGLSTTALPMFAIVVRDSNTVPTDAPPKIVGTPQTSIIQGTAYAFQPTATDANGDALTFSIVNKPSWMSFSTSTGRLSGTPLAANVAQYPDIRISVSDGKNTVSLPAFTLTVVQSGTASMSVSWQPPIANTDGTPLTNLAGFKIHYGTTSTNLDRIVTVASPSATSFVVTNLVPGTYYVSMTSYNSSGIESVRSTVIGRTIN